jgi:hypothetical protein
MPVDGDLHKAAHKGDIEELKEMLGPVEVAASDTPEVVPETPVEEGAGGEEEYDRIGVDDLGAQDRTALQRACGAGKEVMLLMLLMSPLVLQSPVFPLTHARATATRPSTLTPPLISPLSAMSYTHQGHLECVTYLIQKGADATRPDKAGRTALHWAAIAGHTEVVAHLLATVETVDVFAATESGITALHAAVNVKNTAVLNLLVAKCKEQVKEATEEEQAAKLQAFFAAPNKEGQSAWDVGVAAKDKELCTALREAGDEQVVIVGIAATPDVGRLTRSILVNNRT